MSYAGMGQHRHRLANRLEREGCVPIHRHGERVATLVEVDRFRFELRAADGLVRIAFTDHRVGAVARAERSVDQHPDAYPKNGGA